MKNWIRTSLLLSCAGLAGGCQLMGLDDPAKLAELVPQAAEIIAPTPPPLPPEPPLADARLAVAIPLVAAVMTRTALINDRLSMWFPPAVCF